MFDAMDTMWIMGLQEMFREGVEIAAKSTFALHEVRMLTIPPCSVS